jgi:hypothetical protein
MMFIACFIGGMLISGQRCGVVLGSSFLIVVGVSLFSMQAGTYGAWTPLAVLGAVAAHQVGYLGSIIIKVGSPLIRRG